MAYISNEFTHFVGRSLRSDKDRYDLLCKIVREGILMDPSQGASPVMYVPKPGSFAMTLREVRSLSGEVLFEEPKSGSRAQIIDDVYNFHNFRLLYARYKALEGQFVGAKSTNEVDEVVQQFQITTIPAHSDRFRSGGGN